MLTRPPLNPAQAREVRYGVRSGPLDWGRLCLMVFSGFQLFSLGRAFFAKFLGEWVADVAGELNGASVLFLIISAAVYARTYGINLSWLQRMWLVVVVAMIAILTAWGMAQHLMVKYIAYDTFSFSVVLCFVVLGAIPAAVEEIKRQWFWIVLFAIPLNMLAITDMAEMTSELTAGVRMARDTISYRTQNSLDVVILCGAFAFQYVGWKRLVVAFGFGWVLIQQMLYQKRLETVFYIAVLFMISRIWMTADPALRAKLKRYIASFLVCVTMLFVAAFVLNPDVMLSQGDALLRRLSGNTNDVQFHSGFARYTFVENERFTMVKESLEMMSPVELAFGRGMGGGVELHYFDTRLLSSSERESYWASYYLPDYGFFGRRGFEVGMAVPILKGGVVFFVIYYFGFWMVFANWRRATLDLQGRLAFGLLCAFWTYTFFGGDFTLSTVFQVANTGTCLGICFATMNRSYQLRSPQRGARGVISG